MVIAHPLSNEMIGAVGQALRRAKNNGITAVEVLSKMIAEDDKLRAELAKALVQGVRLSESESRRLRREGAESEGESEGGPGARLQDPPP